MARNQFFMPREDKRLGDGYQLLECLGDGSYGWVWRAEKLETHEIVAVKIPKEQGEKTRILRKAKSWSRKKLLIPTSFASIGWIAFHQRRSGTRLRWSIFQA